MLEDVLKSYKELANTVNWKSYDKNELFYKYIEHENDELRDGFYAGIVCRFWGYSGRIYNQCNKHVPFEQCYDVLIDTINYVLKKRVWENPESSLYQDPAAPDKAFHIALKRQRSILLANLTAQKRQSNFNTLSIDGAYEDYKDATEGLLGIFDASSEIDINEISIKEYIKNLEPIEKVFIDLVYNTNWSNLKSVVTNIKKVEESNFKYYNTYYDISEKEFKEVLLEVYKSSNQRLMLVLKRCLNKIREDNFND